MTQSVTAKYGRSIALLFIAIFIKEVIWFCLIPPFQVGDEASHYDYVVYQAKQKIPGKPIDLRFVDTSGFDYSKKEGFGYTSGEVNYLNTALRSEFVHEYRKRRYPRSVIFPFILSQDLAAPHIQDLALYKKENVLNTASQYPPLYYAISAFFYRFAAAIDKNNILLPFYFVRFSSIIYFILSLFLFNKIMARLKIGRKLAFSIMALIGFQPELSMTTVSVNPDNLVMLLTALITYCAVDIFNSKFVNKTPAFIALGFLSGLLWLTKTHFFIDRKSVV